MFVFTLILSIHLFGIYYFKITYMDVKTFINTVKNRYIEPIFSNDVIRKKKKKVSWKDGLVEDKKSSSDDRKLRTQVRMNKNGVKKSEELESFIANENKKAKTFIESDLSFQRIGSLPSRNTQYENNLDLNLKKQPVQISEIYDNLVSTKQF